MSDKSDAVVRGLISLAHNLDLSVTAEGVESRNQLRFLQNEGCDSIQGFVACKPVDPHRFGQLLRADVTLEELKHDAGAGGLVLGPNGRPVSSTMKLGEAIDRESAESVSAIITL